MFLFCWIFIRFFCWNIFWFFSGVFICLVVLVVWEKFFRIFFVFGFFGFIRDLFWFSNFVMGGFILIGVLVFVKSCFFCFIFFLIGFFIFILFVCWGFIVFFSRFLDFWGFTVFFKRFLDFWGFTDFFKRFLDFFGFVVFFCMFFFGISFVFDILLSIRSFSEVLEFFFCLKDLFFCSSFLIDLFLVESLLIIGVVLIFTSKGLRFLIVWLLFWFSFFKFLFWLVYVFFLMELFIWFFLFGRVLFWFEEFILSRLLELVWLFVFLEDKKLYIGFEDFEDIIKLFFWILGMEFMLYKGLIGFVFFILFCCIDRV